ncbi:hypothetical protein LDL36_20460 [Komagataeibacter sp. FNDCR1]|nr:hypothetical protein [Komagataeibacter sp. FNDCR1]
MTEKTNPAPTAGGFDALLNDLSGVEEMRKSRTTDKGKDDPKEGGNPLTEEELEKARKKKEAEAKAAEEARRKAGEGGEEDDDDAEMFGKSLTVTLEGGETAEAVDGAALVTGMRFLKGQNAALASELAAARAENAGEMVKALSGMQSLLRLVKDQDTVIKSLSDRLDTFGAQGRGRASVLSIMEKSQPAGAPAQPQGASRAEIMQASMQAMKKGLISAVDVSMIEGCLNQGADIPESLVKAIQSV